MRGFVVAAEGDLIGVRLIGTEAQRGTVLPVLLEGTDTTAFPYLLHGRVYADFRDAVAYFDRVIDLVLSIYGIEARHPLRPSYAARRLRHGGSDTRGDEDSPTHSQNLRGEVTGLWQRHAVWALRLLL